MTEKNLSVVFEGDVPAHIGRGIATMTVVLTETSTIQDTSPNAGQVCECSISSISSSRTTSSNTLQVPEIDPFDSRRRSWSSLQEHDSSILKSSSTSLHLQDYQRRKSAPDPAVRRFSLVPLWRLRKPFFPARRRLTFPEFNQYQVCNSVFTCICMY